MNLSPQWAQILNEAGHEAVHWSEIGSPSATDFVLLSHAKNQGFIVFTHDLDFGAILAVTQANAPSVIQLRAQDVTPDHGAKTIITALTKFSAELKEGALISIDEQRARIRLLPLKH
jgi:predicted nuclease of predicted toxin-antitoxin system